MVISVISDALVLTKGIDILKLMLYSRTPDSVQDAPQTHKKIRRKGVFFSHLFALYGANHSPRESQWSSNALLGSDKQTRLKGILYYPLMVNRTDVKSSCIITPYLEDL